MTLSGSDVFDIHVPQAPPPWASSPVTVRFPVFVWDGAANADRSRSLLERPTFFRASFVLRLDSMAEYVCMCVCVVGGK